jgi:hypothetical protein
MESTESDARRRATCCAHVRRACYAIRAWTVGPVARVNDCSFIYFSVMIRSFKLPGANAFENIAHARAHGKRDHGRVNNIASLVDFQSLKSRSRENHEALVCRFLLLRERAIRRLRYVSGVSSNIEIPSTNPRLLRPAANPFLSGRSDREVGSIQTLTGCTVNRLSVPNNHSSVTSMLYKHGSSYARGCWSRRRVTTSSPSASTPAEMSTVVSRVSAGG